MGEIKTAVSGDVMIITVVGTVTAKESVNAVQGYYAGHITKNVIWHLSPGSTKYLTSSDLRDISDLIFAHAHVRAGGKTAFVAPADLEYGMCRMLCAFAEFSRIPLEVEIFRTLSQAAEWMGVAELPMIEEPV